MIARGDELVTLKTRTRRDQADALHALARIDRTSVAALIRRAIDNLLTDARKDGRL